MQAECHFCGKLGHIARACRSRLGAPQRQQGRNQPKQPAYLVSDSISEPPDSVYDIHHLSGNSPDPLYVTVNIDGADLPMQVDTGASRSIISAQTYYTLWSATKRPPLKPCDVRLRTYSGEALKVLGCIDVAVCYDQQSQPLQLLVVATNGPPLFGRNWLQAIKLNWKEVHFMQHAEQHQSLQDLCTKYSSLFEDGMGTLQGAIV